MSNWSQLGKSVNRIINQETKGDGENGTISSI